MTEPHPLGPWWPGALALLLMVCAVVLPLVARGRLGAAPRAPRWLGWLPAVGSATLLVLALGVLELLAYQHQLYVGGNGHVVVTSCTLLEERIDAEVPAGEVSRVVLRRGRAGATLTFERQKGRGTSLEVRGGNEETARLLADRIGATLVIELRRCGPRIGRALEHLLRVSALRAQPRSRPRPRRGAAPALRA